MLVLEDQLLVRAFESDAELGESHSSGEEESSFEYHTDQSNFV